MPKLPSVSELMVGALLPGIRDYQPTTAKAAPSAFSPRSAAPVSASLTSSNFSFVDSNHRGSNSGEHYAQPGPPQKQFAQNPLPHPSQVQSRHTSESVQQPSLVLLLAELRMSILAGSVLTADATSAQSDRPSQVFEKESPPLLPRPRSNCTSPWRHLPPTQTPWAGPKVEPNGPREQPVQQTPRYEEYQPAPKVEPSEEQLGRPSIRPTHAKLSTSAPQVATLSHPNASVTPPSVPQPMMAHHNSPYERQFNPEIHVTNPPPAIQYGQNPMGSVQAVSAQYPGQVPMMVPVQSYNVYRPPMGPQVPYTYGVGMPPVVPIMARSGEVPTYGPMMVNDNRADRAERSTGDQNNALVNKRRIIKRRTRTGCLTCRKRRIKCDERKPHCYNCERSKKLCLGYEAVPQNNGRRRHLENSDKSEKSDKSDRRLSIHDLM